MRLATDLFAYCAERLLPSTRSRSPGTTSAKPVRARRKSSRSRSPTASRTARRPSRRGCPPTTGERLSFFFNAHNHFFQEVAKFRAARRLWAEIMRDNFGATNPRALALRFHAQTGGSTLTAQQPENNIVRVAVQAVRALRRRAVAATRTRSTRRSRSRASTQRRSPPHAADPRSRGRDDSTRRIRSAARTSSRRSPTSSNSAHARSSRESTTSAAPSLRSYRSGVGLRHQRDVESGERVVVGVNAFTEGTRDGIELLHVDPAIERHQRERIGAWRAARGRSRRRQRSTRCVASRRPMRTSSRRCARHSAADARSARSAAPFASFGVHMTPSMRSRRTWIALALALIPAVAIPFAAVAMTGRTPSFTRDVAPIIADKCAGCHQTGGIAPFPLETSKQISTQGGSEQRCRRGSCHPGRPAAARLRTRDKRRER